MALYSIKDLEQLSGIKAHTIRIWEQRYNLISPKRSETNIRNYDDQELIKLLKVASLYHQGHKISKLAHVSEKELNRLVSTQIPNDSKFESACTALTIAMIQLDEDQFLLTYHYFLNEIGFEKTIVEIIYPFLTKIGIMWQMGDIHPAQEHFISNLIRQKLIAFIDQIKIPTSDQKPIILFIPEGDLHELGLLFYNALLRNKGHKTVYLGQSVPLNDILSTAQAYKSHVFMTSVINPAIVEQFGHDLKTLYTEIPSAQVYVGGALSEQLISLNNKILQIKSPADLNFV